MDTRKNYPRVKDWRRRNPEKQAAASKRAQERRVALVRAAKEKPCKDCGIQYPYYVMQFDHIPERGAKKFGLATMHLGSWGIGSIGKEIEKCDVVCSNCHAIRTWTRHRQALSKVIDLTHVA